MPEVGDVGHEDVARISQMLARAFLGDPVAEYLFSPWQREKRLARFFTMQLRHNYLHRGTVYATPARDAAALWIPPRPVGLGRKDRLAFAVLPFVTMSRFFASQSLSNQLLAAHPKVPHYYLGTLGTDPAVQGRGLGTSLLREGLSLCDESQLPVYLECSRVENISFYARFGFTVTSECVVGSRGPTLWLMWRVPQQPDR